MHRNYHYVLYHAWRCLSVIVIGFLLNSCAGMTHVPEAVSIPPVLQEYAIEGPHGYLISRGEFRGPFGCLTHYEIYRPESPLTDTMVFLCHGFTSNLTSMQGWAMHWASHGVPTTVMSTCNATWFNGHHDRNAADIRALAEKIHTGSVLYAGFSSGGLATLIAAVSDGRTIAYLGLDTVDTGSLAREPARNASFPAFLILGEPSSCNANNNIRAVLPLIDEAIAAKVRYATHCHFENPYNASCEKICGKIEPAGASERIMALIRGLATAWILLQAEAKPSAGEVLDSVLEEERFIEKLR